MRNVGGQGHGEQVVLGRDRQAQLALHIAQQARRELQLRDINVAIHPVDALHFKHHMIGEDPRIIFLHYYGTGPAETLAQGFRAALDELGKHGAAMRM